MANRHPMEIDDYFVPPHGGRPPSDEAVRKQTQRYIEQEKKDTLFVQTLQDGQRRFKRSK